MSVGLSYFLCKYSYFICPIEYNESLGQMSHWGCEPSINFVSQEFNLPETVSTLRRMIGMKETITLYPFLLHAFFMSMFASVIGPFGGFFASGFKRAFKIKVKNIIISNTTYFLLNRILGTLFQAMEELWIVSIANF